MQKDLARENAIKELRANGATLQLIGDKYGISRERVRQILRAAGVVGPASKSHIVPCQSCGKPRRFSPYKYRQYIEHGLRAFCVKCVGARRSSLPVRIRCPSCGKVRSMRPSEARKLKRLDGLCQACYRARFGAEYWGLDK